MMNLSLLWWATRETGDPRFAKVAQIHAQTTLREFLRPDGSVSHIIEFDPETGKRVVAFCMTRDEMEMVGMGGEHCGDIFMQLMPTYCETHGNCPSTVEHENYSLNNLCMMIGSDFKQGEFIRRVIRITDVVPTLCYLCDNEVPSNCEGGVIWQALKNFTEERFTREVVQKNVRKDRYVRLGD